MHSSDVSQPLSVEDTSSQLTEAPASPIQSVAIMTTSSRPPNSRLSLDPISSQSIAISQLQKTVLQFIKRRGTRTIWRQASHSSITPHDFRQLFGGWTLITKQDARQSLQKYFPAKFDELEDSPRSGVQFQMRHAWVWDRHMWDTFDLTNVARSRVKGCTWTNEDIYKAPLEIIITLRVNSTGDTLAQNRSHLRLIISTLTFKAYSKRQEVAISSMYHGLPWEGEYDNVEQRAFKFILVELDLQK